MNPRSFALSFALLPTALLVTGCPNCEYESRCDGNTLKTCGMGVDQLVGEEGRDSAPCPPENPVCVRLDGRTAQCVRPGKPTCGPDFVARCEGDVSILCVEGYESGDDCAAAGNVCTSSAGEARCAYPPLAACDPATYVRTCEGDGYLECRGDVVLRSDCARYGPFQTCLVSRSEYGRSVYCGGRE